MNKKNRAEYEQEKQSRKSIKRTEKKMNKIEEREFRIKRMIR